MKFKTVHSIEKALADALVPMYKRSIVIYKVLRVIAVTVIRYFPEPLHTNLNRLA